MLRYVLFDAAGTLIHARPSVAEVYAAHGARYGSRLSATEIRPRFTRALQQLGAQASCDEASERQRWQAIVAHVFDDVADTAELFAELWLHFAQSESWTLYDDVAPAWQALAAQGVTLGIASNFDARLLAICRAHPPLDTCRHLFLSSHVGFAKPHVRFFASVAADLHAKTDEILLIGDDPVHDIAGARAAGWQAILIDRSTAISAPGAVRDLREIVPLVLALR